MSVGSGNHDIQSEPIGRCGVGADGVNGKEDGRAIFLMNTLKPRKESTFVLDNAVRLAKTFAAIEWSTATESVREGVRAVCTSLAIEVLFCKLCSRPFSPKRSDQEFCCTKHSEKYYNGFKRQT